MKPLLLKMQAFGPFNKQQELDFTLLGEKAFFLIHGPTGAGKSTLFDAMCFALYGQSSGNADALALAARKFVRKTPHVIGV